METCGSGTWGGIEQQSEGETSNQTGNENKKHTSPVYTKKLLETAITSIAWSLADHDEYRFLAVVCAVVSLSMKQPMFIFEMIH